MWGDQMLKWFNFNMIFDNEGTSVKPKCYLMQLKEKICSIIYSSGI